MRLVGVNQLIEGMVLAENVLDYSGRILLLEGVTLRKSIINRLKKRGIYAVHIVEKDRIGTELSLSREDAMEKMEFAFKEITLKKSVSSNAFCETITKLVNEIIDLTPVVAFVSEITNYDNYTSEHSFNVAVLSILTGFTLGMKRDDLIELGIGALLHDIGKMLIPQEILNKPGQLTPKEWDAVKKHPEQGYKLLENNKDITERTLSVIKEHHERINGTGYPYGLKKGQISLGGRITMIADTFDAMTSNRPYKRGVTPFEALQVIKSMSDLHYDRKVVDAFLKNIIPYPIGSAVKLSDGHIGVVVAVSEDDEQELEVELMYNQDGYMIESKDKREVTRRHQFEIVGLVNA